MWFGPPLRSLIASLCFSVLGLHVVGCNSCWERLHLRNQCGSHESQPVSRSEDSDAVDQSTSYISNT